jgi:tripartite-type tricarboxylate transporter receptor subunit TctC
MFYPAVGIADLVAQKRLKVIAVGTRQPWADFPGVPTMEEMGLRGFDATAPWVGLLAPAGTPPAIVSRVSAEMRKSLAKPDTLARMKGLGAIVVADNPAEFAAFLQKDHERWAQVIKTAGVKAE